MVIKQRPTVNTVEEKTETNINNHWKKWKLKSKNKKIKKPNHIKHRRKTTSVNNGIEREILTKPV